MKILITGASGQLGWELQHALADHELYLSTSQNYDITNKATVQAETEAFGPEVIIHAAAYTNVDKAETDRETCRAVNVDGTRHVAEAAATVNAKVVAVSTDYVFAGDKGEPYAELDSPSPVSFYGQTKYESEKAVIAAGNKHFICRTSWLYGGSKPMPNEEAPVHFKNFVRTMLRVGKGRENVDVVADQLGSPTYAKDVAVSISQLIKSDSFGIYHLTNAGVASWADFAEEIFGLAKYDTTVNRITTDTYQANNPTATSRPAYSVLGHQSLIAGGFDDLRHWREAIADYLSEFANE